MKPTANRLTVWPLISQKSLYQLLRDNSKKMRNAIYLRGRFTETIIIGFFNQTDRRDVIYSRLKHSLSHKSFPPQTATAQPHTKLLAYPIGVYSVRWKITKTSCRPPQYAPAPCELDFWPFDLQRDVRVTCHVIYANFSLHRPLCSRLRPDVRDRQTDVRQHHRLMPPPRGIINRIAFFVHQKCSVVVLYAKFCVKFPPNLEAGTLPGGLKTLPTPPQVNWDSQLHEPVRQVTIITANWTVSLVSAWTGLEVMTWHCCRRLSLGESAQTLTVTFCSHHRLHNVNGHRRKHVVLAILRCNARIGFYVCPCGDKCATRSNGPQA